MIDTIDTHVEQTQQHVTEGSKEVSKAIDYRKKSRKKLWWIVILIIILVVIIGLVLFFYWIKPSFIDKKQ
jgi:syntaxin 1B/2/3